jgi:DNA-binding response OmpR family regulator
VGERAPDLVVLDVMLPGIDGLEVMRRIRESRRPAPAIILLTAKGEESDRVTGLRLGADDYVVKPFSPAELVARVDAILRRTDTVGDREPVLSVAGLRIDLAGRSVHRDGAELVLTPREFDLLAFLARHPGRAFTREALLDHVWQYAFYSDTSTVTVHVRRLRGKVEQDPDRPVVIETSGAWGIAWRPLRDRAALGGRGLAAGLALLAALTLLPTDAGDLGDVMLAFALLTPVGLATVAGAELLAARRRRAPSLRRQFGSWGCCPACSSPPPRRSSWG